jgi:CHRD domain-containing protein
MQIRGEASALVRAGGGAPAPVKEDREGQEGWDGMRIRRGGVTIVLTLVAVLLLGRASFGQGDTFKARLSRVPIESSTLGITGSGSATATLSGARLSVRGNFEGLQSPATIAQIRLGQRGIRGPVMFDLTVTKATSGTIAGTFTLRPEQVEAVRLGRFYVQIHSEKAPDGNLWGWLLP